MKEVASLLSDPGVAELVLESIPRPVMMVSNDSTILYLNSAMEKFLNINRSQILGQPLLQTCYPGQSMNRKGRCRSPLLETLLTGREFSNQLVEIKTVFHVAPRLVQLSTFLIREVDGKIKGACVFFSGNAYDGLLIQPSTAPLEQFETIYAFAEAIGTRDGYTMGHSEKVAEYSRLIAERMGLDANTIDLAYLCGIVHDVGKIGIPEEILNKKGPLNNEEYQLIKGHSQMGASILSHISWLRDIVPIIEAHHEWYSGTGYPRGLEGDEIPLISRILSVADSFDAMTSDRSYRKAYPIEKAVEELKINSGTQFDPKIVEIFIEMLQEYS